MSNNDAETRIRACINSFVLELTSIIQDATVDSIQKVVGNAVESARGDSDPSPTPKPATTKSAPRRRKSGRRTSADVQVTMEHAAACVMAHPGCAVSDISKEVGVSTNDLRFPLQKLLEDGILRRTGQKRGARYHPAKGSAARPAKKTAGRKKATTKTRKSAASR